MMMVILIVIILMRTTMQIVITNGDNSENDCNEFQVVTTEKIYEMELIIPNGTVFFKGHFF